MVRNLSYSIIPGAGLQFLDYDLDLSGLVGGKPLAKKRKPFHLDLKPAKAAGDYREKIPLIPLEELEGRPGEYVSRQERRELPLHFELEYLQAFKVFQNQWLPLPFLVEIGAWPDGLPRYGYGPTDWVRGRLGQLGPDDSTLFRLTLVFDPVVEEAADGRNLPTESQVYHTLSETDVAGNVFFSLATHERDSAWFIKNLPWVEEAVEQIHARYKKERPRLSLARFAPGAPEYVEAETTADNSTGSAASARLEAQALYLTLLEGLALTGVLRPVRVITPDKTKPLDVDLVLDIGNSRLTGVLVETAPQRATNLTDCYALQIRDLSDPGRVYAEPLETKVEFSEPFFGRREWSLASRRHSDSFNWPSAVRLGPEATRLAADSREEKGPTGLSSPKRYLWDTRVRDMEWHLNNSGAPHRGPEEPAVGRGSFLELVNAAGTPLSAFNDPGSRHLRVGSDLVAFEAKYTRSSLMMFLLGEIIAQALATINSPLVRDNREHPDTPRRLRSLILTVPTAMPLAEQNIFKTWARLAVETVWEALGWQKRSGAAGGQGDFKQKPKVRCDWDEATCTQVVWLYNELHEKFHNNAGELFNLLGKKRALSLPANSPNGSGQPVETLRIASIDMGGGTTDLSITTYAIHDPGSATPHIKPHQNFRDGFNVAGDDIMRKIIRDHFLKKLVEAATRAGVADADSHISNLFKDVAQMGSAGDKAGRALRAQFVRQVAGPIALNILSQYESADLHGDQIRLDIRVGEALGLGKTGLESLARVLNYLEEPLQRAGWPDFSLPDFTFPVDLQEVDQSVRSIVEKIMDDMGEVIHLYDCDMLLLTGRPSRWPALISAPYRRPALPPDRITHMHNYRVGAKYPFVRHGRIEDPKTTVVVGAIICALAEGFLEGLTIDTSSFAPRPTARYLGLLDGAGRLSREHVWFEAVDVDNPDEVAMTAQVNFTAPMAVGFRQLSVPRWTTTRLYLLDYASAQARERSAGNLPYLLNLSYTLKADPGEEGSRQGLNKREEGALYIEEALDRQGRPVARDLTIRLQTLRRDAGYWLDTGALEDY